MGKLQRSYRNLGIVLVLLLGTLMAACQSAKSLTLPSKVLSYPAADYESLMQVEQQPTAFVRNQNPISTPQQYARLGDLALHQIQLPQDNRCTQPTTLYLADPLPDGRLQLWESCYLANYPGAAITLRSFDLATTKTAPIGGILPLGSKNSTWNREQSLGLVYLDNGYASRTLYWITRDGFRPLNLVIGEEGKLWNLQDDFPRFAAAEKGLTGTTGRVAWSPDGTSIAFFASPNAIGKIGADRFNVEYDLYLIDANTLKPRAVQSEIYFPFFIKWSPDSRYVAFISQYGSPKQDGIWIYSSSTNKIYSVTTGKFQDILWSPDERSLMAIQCDDQYYCSKILEYDVSSIVKP